MLFYFHDSLGRNTIAHSVSNQKLNCSRQLAPCLSLSAARSADRRLNVTEKMETKKKKV